MKRPASCTLAAALLAFLPAASWPQTPAETALQKQVDQLQAELKAMRSDLEQLKATLHDMTAPRNNPVMDLGTAPSMGEISAPVVLIEFSDYQCPFCLDYFSNTYRKVISDYVKTGKLRYVVRDLPGESIHPNAMMAAQAAHCAAEQDKFWPMHDNLFANQKTLGSGGIPDSAAAAGLDASKFQSCLDSAKYLPAIRKDEDEATRLGANGTPAFFLGTPDPANPSSIKLTRLLIGSQPLSAFQQAIDSMLPK